VVGGHYARADKGCRLLEQMGRDFPMWTERGRQKKPREDLASSRTQSKKSKATDKNRKFLTIFMRDEERKAKKGQRFDGGLESCPWRKTRCARSPKGGVSHRPVWVEKEGRVQRTPCVRGN